jgi:hypothetical protein
MAHRMIAGMLVYIQGVQAERPAIIGDDGSV